MTLADASWFERVDSAVDAFHVGRAARTVADRQLADLLRGIAASARTGATLAQSLDQAARRGDGRPARLLGEASARIRMGVPATVALEEFADTVDSAAARLFARVVAIQHRRGGDLAGPCHRLATLLHERCRLDAEARTSTAQARFSARAVLLIPLLLLGFATWRAPDTVRAMLTPGMLLLATPGILLIVVGTIVAMRVARRAIETAGVGEPSAEVPRAARRAVVRLAGSGPRSLRSLRLGVVAMVVAAPVVLLGAGGTFAIVGMLAFVGAAVAWPWSERARRRARDARVAASGIETLLEVSIALFAAGATAHDVATIAPASCPPALRSALAPAVHGVGLGRSVSSAFQDLSVVRASPILDGWLHALGSSAELGSRSVGVLDQLLRDARMQRREQLRSAAQTAAPRMQLALVLLVVPGVMWIMLLATVGGLVEQLRAAGVA